MRKMVRGSLTEDNKNCLDESLQKGNTLNGERQEFGALALFLFFFRILPYHLFHREQTQLFLLATEPLAGYLRHPALWHVCQEIPHSSSFITKGVVRP